MYCTICPFSFRFISKYKFLIVFNSIAVHIKLFTTFFFVISLVYAKTPRHIMEQLPHGIAGAKGK